VLRLVAKPLHDSHHCGMLLGRQLMMTSGQPVKRLTW
jgi:hypothetical protein